MRAPSISSVQLLLHALLADELGERARVAARRRTRGPPGRRRRPRSGGRSSSLAHRPTFCSASRRRSSASRPSTSSPRIASPASAGREPERQQRLAHVGQRSLRRKLALAAELVAQVEHHALRDLLARRRARPSARRRRRATTARRSASGASADRNASATFGPTPVTPVSRSNSVALVGGGEPVQRHRVLAHDHPGVQAGASSRSPGARPRPTSAPARRSRRRRRRARRGSRPSRRPHPRGTRSPRARPSGGARMRRRRRRWVSATATASAASGCSGTSRSPWMRASARRTCALSALPIPVTAFLTSVGPYSSTGEPGLGGDHHDRAGRPRDRERAHLVPVPRHPLDRHGGGRCSAIAVRIAVGQHPEPSRLVEIGGVRTVSLQTSDRRPVAPGDHGEAETGPRRGRHRAHRSSNIRSRSLGVAAGPGGTTC